MQKNTMPGIRAAGWNSRRRMATLAVAAWLAGELVFLAPYKASLFRQHGWLLGGATLVLFFNLCALYYSVARWLFLRDSGRKLLHLDRQLGTSDTALDDLGPRFDA
mgnify:CR=1 FL=1